MYRDYLDMMKLENLENAHKAMEFSLRLVKSVTGIAESKLRKMDTVAFLVTLKSIHIAMQEVVTKQMMELSRAEQVEREASAFDEYDEEEGYNESEQEENPWKTCKKLTDQIVKICIRILRMSYAECMREDAVKLFDYLKYELETLEEKH
jgi:hypothetical protein